MLKPRTPPSTRTAFLVRGEYDGQHVWHYVLVDKLKLPLFQEKLKLGQLDVAQYGEIIDSGWGKNPPVDVAKKIEQRYG